ncbi:MAG: YkgJ family cysteine cluster protein [Dehalococcoidia bacterium]|nr:YkgJ family cysteine cluster protein [Dehalococcoidia bacterium]
METAVIPGGDASREPVDSGPLTPVELPCLRCGVCCTVYQVRLSPGEAQEIAHAMGLDYWDWVGRFCDPRWPDPRSHLLRHDDHGCVFLHQTQEKVALCRIYRVRPLSCRDWAAGVFKPACQDGLKRYWQVEVDDAGRLRGTPDALARLDEFIRSL